MGFQKLDQLNQFSPKLCRAFASKNGRLLTQRELELRSGISRASILRLSKLSKWDNVPMGLAFGYAAACGFRLHRIRADFYLRIRKMKSVCINLTASQRKMLSDLLTN